MTSSCRSASSSSSEAGRVWVVVVGHQRGCYIRPAVWCALLWTARGGYSENNSAPRTSEHSSPAHPNTPRALEEAVYEEAGHEEECTREQVVQALLKVDQDVSEKAAQQVGAGGWVLGGLRCGRRRAWRARMNDEQWHPPSMHGAVVPAHP